MEAARRGCPQCPAGGEERPMGRGCDCACMRARVCVVVLVMVVVAVVVCACWGNDIQRSTAQHSASAPSHVQLVVERPEEAFVVQTLSRSI